MEKEDLKTILEQYNLGKLRSFKKIIRKEGTHHTCFIITTTKGKYFLKYYSGGFNESVKKGLRLLDFLRKKNYPSVRIHKTNKGKHYLINKRKAIAIFEFLNLKENKKLSSKETYEMGKTLARLHLLTKNIKMKVKGYPSYTSLFQKNKHLKEKGPKLIKEIIKYAEKESQNIKVPKNQPKAICHEEFSIEHVRFKKGKIIKVIDWDLINRDYMIHDLGTLMTNAFENGKLRFNTIRLIIRGYNEQRKLTKWEREHLFEALEYGMFKYLTWGLDEPLGKDYLTHLKNIDSLKNIGKEKFQKLLKHQVK